MIRKGDFMHYEARGTLMEKPPKSDDRTADLRAILTDLNRRLEERIREYPEQYFWMHRRWKRLGIHGSRKKKEAAAEVEDGVSRVNVSVDRRRSAAEAEVGFGNDRCGVRLARELDG